MAGKTILVIGSGGCEDVICWKFTQSEEIGKVFLLSFRDNSSDPVCRPKTELVVDISIDDHAAIVEFCKKNGITIVFVASTNLSVIGLVDALLGAHINCFGAPAIVAHLTLDKSSCKNFLTAAAIPTARYECFDDIDAAKAYIKSNNNALVVKSSGLTVGKGVVVANSKEEACVAVDDFLGEQIIPIAGSKIVIEEKLSGEEISLMAFVDGNTIKMMIPAQNYKRMHNGDKGPITEGMGAYCPCPLINNAYLELSKKEIIERAMAEFKKREIKFCGVLYARIILTETGPRVIKFNCQFGDPETEVIMPLLKNDLSEIVEACCNNQLDNIELVWKEAKSAVGIVIFNTEFTGKKILGLLETKEDKAIMFHINTELRDSVYIARPGRALVYVAIEGNLQSAVAAANKKVRSIEFFGRQYRTDIAHNVT